MSQPCLPEISFALWWAFDPLGMCQGRQVRYSSKPCFTRTCLSFSPSRKTCKLSTTTSKHLMEMSSSDSDLHLEHVYSSFIYGNMSSHWQLYLSDAHLHNCLESALRRKSIKKSNALGTLKHSLLAKTR